jgi:hypothetical protein
MLYIPISIIYSQIIDLAFMVMTVRSCVNRVGDYMIAGLMKEF